MASTLKIGVIGSICYDYIVLPNNIQIESFGGITYNLLALAISTNHTIYPITWIGKNKAVKLFSILKKYSNIKHDFIRTISSPTYEVKLHYTSNTERKEVPLNKHLPIKIPQLLPTFDILLINFISSYDISLDKLIWLRNNFNNLIYLDVHALTCRGEVDDRVISCCDILQVNEREAIVLGAGNNYIEFGKRLLRAGPKVIIITLGEKGYLVCYAKRCKKVEVEKARVIDVTGAGDTFSGGFVANYLETRDPLEACRFGALIAKKCCEGTGIKGLEKIKL